MKTDQLTLSQLNTQIQEALDEAFPSYFWVKAEISELTINRAGHCYLELIELDETTKETVARARATIWSYAFRMLKPYFETTTGQSFAQGIKILVQAKAEFHPVYGFSLNIRDIDPAYTMGDMALRRKEIIAQLQADGIFDMNRELYLPLVPQRVAIISSPTAAGLQDFMEQLAQNQYGYRFYTKLFAAQMQGGQTAPSIISALDSVFQYNNFFDVVVIIRGGGAQADLASFDHYELACHVAQFPLPILSGIGHEKDDTIVDLVAHTRLKTPTAVAEFLVAGARAFDEQVDAVKTSFTELVEERLTEENEQLKEAAQQLKQSVKSRLQREEHHFGLIALKLKKGAPALLAKRARQYGDYRFRLKWLMRELIRHQQHTLDNNWQKLHFQAQRQLEQAGARLQSIQKKVTASLPDKFRIEKHKLDGLKEKARLVDPEQVLKRGYALLYSGGKIVKSSKMAQKGEMLEARLHDGTIESQITKIK